VDHEGGRVQRFQEGFTRIPPMRTWGGLGKRSVAGEGRSPEATGYSSRRSCARTASFQFCAPCARRGLRSSSVIGDRAFSDEPEVIAALAVRSSQGDRRGAASSASIFPGHG